ncbi:MAG: aldo/keto reductase [Bryobacteraceae bacterium]
MSISRRQFFEKTAAIGVAANAAQSALGMQVDKQTGMPIRVLGRTGARVSILAFGSGSRFLSYKEEDQAAEALNKALALGINYVDTACAYGNGASEERIGRILKGRRKNIFLATKVSVRNGDEAMRSIEGSLKRLQTDQLDLLHIHNLTNEADLAAVEAADGVLKVLYRMRDQKAARFIGITSHTDPLVLKTALERHDFDCTQMALNAAKVGMARTNTETMTSFENLALPVANRKGMGVIAMKIFAQDGLVGKAPVEKLISYSLSLPVAAAVLGMPKLEHIDENIRVAKAFRPLPQSEMDGLSGTLASRYKASLDRYFYHHVDA